MIIDKELYLSEAQAVTATADSTDVIDLTKAGDARGEELYVVIGVDTLAESGGSTTVTFEVQTSADNSTYVTLLTTGAIAKAALVAGAEVLKAKLPLGVRRYVKVVYTVAVANLTAGKFNAFLTPQIDTAAGGLNA